MDSYSFRKNNTNNLPKVTNSTFYKTLKFAKTKNKSTIDMHQNNLSNFYDGSITIKGQTIKNSHSPIPLFEMKKKIYSSKIRKQMRSSSVPSSNISSQETDDSLFALSQIRNMDRFISKRINKNVVWKEKARNIYEINTSRNYKEIKSIKDRIHESRFEDAKNFDLKYEISRKKYFPIEKVEVVNEARNIAKKLEVEFNKNKSVSNFFIKKRVDIQTFATQNREICFKNNMINLLIEESNKIKQKEKDYAKALDDANKGFLKDKEAFEKIIIEHKAMDKKKELEVEKAKIYRKKLREELYKLNLQIRIKQDEIEKTIKNISACFSYAEFIHSIIGSQSMKKVNINKLNIKSTKNRNKDLIYLTKTTFELFDFLLDNDNRNNKNNKNINFDAEQMAYLFSSKESVILKNIKERDRILEEMKKQNNNSELIFLKKKKSQHEEELEFLNKELDYLKNISQPVDDDYKKNLDTAQKYINEIFKELNNEIGIVNNTKIIDSIEKMDITQSVLDTLHCVEDKLIFYMNEIENIEKSQKDTDDLFKNIIEKVKMENKKIKYQKSRQLLEELEKEKMIKYQQRMNKVIIRSIVEYTPPWIKKQRNKKKKVIVNSEDEDKQLLYYH